MTTRIRRILGGVIGAAALSASALLTASPAQAGAFFLHDEVWTAAGTNWCEYNIYTDNFWNAGVAKDLYVQTHGAGFNCFVQVIDSGGTVRTYYDNPGNGWTRHQFSYGASSIRVCQNGDPGRCGGWRG